MKSRHSTLSLILRLGVIAALFFVPNWLMGPSPVSSRTVVKNAHQFRGKDNIQACGINLKEHLEFICMAFNLNGFYNPAPKLIPAQRSPVEVVPLRSLRAVREIPITDECCRKACHYTQLLKYCGTASRGSNVHHVVSTTTTNAPPTTTATPDSELPKEEEDSIAFLPCVIQVLWDLPSRNRKSPALKYCRRIILETINAGQEEPSNKPKTLNASTGTRTRTGSENSKKTNTNNKSYEVIVRNITERDVPLQQLQSPNPFLYPKSIPRHTPFITSDEIGNGEDSSYETETEELEYVESFTGSPMKSMAESITDEFPTHTVFSIPGDTTSHDIDRIHTWK